VKTCDVTGRPLTMSARDGSAPHCQVGNTALAV